MFPSSIDFNLVGIGETLWDLLPNGPQLGGAPANFACHAKMLGARSRVVTRIGNDSLGHEILQRLNQMGIADGTVQMDDSVATGTATVQLNSNGVPQFTIRENVAWDQLELTPSALAAVREAHAVCFGSLAQRSPGAGSVIQQLVAATPPWSLRVFDINLRQNFYTQPIIEQSLGLANVLKLNDQELPVLDRLFHLGGSVKEQIATLAAQFGLRVVALTRGNNGSLLYQTGGLWSDLPGSSIKVVDTVGAGDSFTAALVMGLLCNMPLDQVHRLAAEIADYVCSCQGATPVLPDYFAKAFVARNANSPSRPSASMPVRA